MPHCRSATINSDTQRQSSGSKKKLADLNNRHDHAGATGCRFKTRLPSFSSRLSRNMLPSNRLLADLAPTAFDGAAVLGTVKAQALRVVAEEATSLDSSCARRLATVADRDEETGFQIEQRNDRRKPGCAS
jgi:hypothetical protein